MFKKNKGRKSSEAKALENGTNEHDGPVLDQDFMEDGSKQNTKRRDSEKKKKFFLGMVPDKVLEESVIELNHTFVSKNLPPDDVAPLMLDRGLLTDMEHSKYRSMRDGSRADYEKSEHLIACLLRRGPGFLRSFCEILLSIGPAKHIAVQLERAYHEQTTKEEFNRRRSSRRSHSDHDIMKKKVSGSSHQSKCCSRCIDLERQLKQSTEELNKSDQSHRDFTQLKQFRDQIEFLIQSSRKQLEQKEREITEIRELITSTKTMIVQLQSSVAVLEDKVAAHNSISTSFEHNVQFLDQMLHIWPTVSHQILHSGPSDKQRLGPSVTTPPREAWKFQNDSDTSDAEPTSDTSLNQTRMIGIHQKQMSESQLLAKQTSTMERTSSHPAMPIMSTLNRSRHSSVPPQETKFTYDDQSSNNSDMYLHTMSQQIPQSDDNLPQHYSLSSSDSNLLEEREASLNHHYHSVVPESIESDPQVPKRKQPRPETKEKPTSSSYEAKHDHSTFSTNESQQSQQCSVSAELQYKLEARLKKIVAES